MTAMVLITEAGRELQRTYFEEGEASSPQVYEAIGDIETEAYRLGAREGKAIERDRIANAITKLPDYHGYTMRPPNAQRWMARGRVVSAIYDLRDRSGEAGSQVVVDPFPDKEATHPALTETLLTTVLYDWMPDGADVAVGFEGKHRHMTGADLATFIFERAAEYDHD